MSLDCGRDRESGPTWTASAFTQWRKRGSNPVNMLQIIITTNSKSTFSWLTWIYLIYMLCSVQQSWSVATGWCVWVSIVAPVDIFCGYLTKWFLFSLTFWLTCFLGHKSCCWVLQKCGSKDSDITKPCIIEGPSSGKFLPVEPRVGLKWEKEKLSKVQLIHPTE